MDAKILYWSGALLNMAVILTLAGLGVRAVQRGAVQAHKRLMGSAGFLVVAFLISFLVKSHFLGREDFETWSSAHVWNLRVHETFVLVMLIAGGVAGWAGWGMRGSRNATRDPADPLAPEDRVLRHRRAGWTAAISGVFGLLTAAVVLVGMIQRAP